MNNELADLILQYIPNFAVVLNGDDIYLFKKRYCFFDYKIFIEYKLEYFENWENIFKKDVCKKCNYLIKIEQIENENELIRSVILIKDFLEKNNIRFFN